MDKDLVYIFDKNTKIGSKLGEIQTNFNMSFVIDGTKDSSTILVLSYSKYKIEPNTILYHKKTNTWWVVSHDKVDRYLNDDGYMYIHTIDILGAVELFNARDLTDCGFNDNTYTTEDFIYRLINLSGISNEFSVDLIANYNFKDKIVNFIKVFENYTLLSALREFLDAYNMCPKVSFLATYNSVIDEYTITKLELEIMVKTGNSLVLHQMDDFEDERETMSMDKNSFGTSVISNAENVISSREKIYPSAGVVGLSSKQYDVTYKNALIRLPSKVYKVNWIKLIATDMNMYIASGSHFLNIKLYYDNDELSIKNIDDALQTTLSGWLEDGYITQEHYDFINENKLLLINKIKLYYTITFYGGIKYNSDDTFTKPDDVPYIPKFIGNGTEKEIIICQKDIKDCMKSTLQGIAWERGSDVITGFDFLENYYEISMQYTDGYLIYDRSPVIYEDHSSEDIFEWLTIYAEGPNISTLEFALKTYTNSKNPCMFIVNYIPMSDLKVKIDNTTNSKDIQLYNQNGKMTDSVALSKILNSYSKEISSETITKYATYYNLNDLPKVGDLVVDGNVNYVINNISMTFNQNESAYLNDFSYIIECEITMSKWFSTKSLMVNPNTNIRDYGIPQNYNVKRKQLYRDYYQLSFVAFDDANTSTPYFSTKNVFDFGNEPARTFDYATYIKITYKNQVDGNYNWYYQLETSTYYLSKQIIVVCDFNDNNIIGYSQMNKTWVLDVSNLFNQRALINTPISYVDNEGNAKDLELLFIKSNNRQIVDSEYYAHENLSQPDFDALLTQVFIPQFIFDRTKQNNYYEFEINIENYNKDALEIPVFECCCQVDDSDDVLIGDNILDQHDGFIYFYSYIVGDNLTQQNVKDTNTFWEPTYPEIAVRQENSAKIEYNVPNNALYIYIYEYTQFSRVEEEWSYGQDVDLTQYIGKDIAIFRTSFNLKTGETFSELLFIAKKIPSSNVFETLSGDLLEIKINHYKLN